MASTTSDANLTFVLQCLQSAIDGGFKINYDYIAETHGLSKQSAYFKLWTLRKKAGLISSPSHDGGDAENLDKPTGKKRGRPCGKGNGGKSKKAKLEPVDTENGGGPDDGAAVGSCDDVKVEESHE